MIENPLAKARADRAQDGRDRRARRSRPTSIMPKGLLDKLTREEILDLIAYIASGANPKSDLYHQGGPRSRGRRALSRNDRPSESLRSPSKASGERGFPVFDLSHWHRSEDRELTLPVRVHGPRVTIV